ncbi:ABC transporter ATP-binding protein [bacterium]|nr:ABC transporter ATP-binding protein [bacterium]
MNIYLRVLRLVRPYLPFILLSMFFMVVFSLLSGLSIVMIAPFLEALFDPEAADVVATVPAAAPADTLAVQEAVSRVEDLQRTFSVTGLRDDLMSRLNGWLQRDTQMATLWVIVLVFFALNLIKHLAGYLQTVFTDYVQLSFIRDLRNRLYEKFTGLPLSFYHRHRAGELISRATNDVLVVNRSVNVSFTNLARDPVMILTYLAMSLLLSWRLTLLAMMVLPLSMLIILRIGKKLRKYSHRQQEKMANITTRLQETISGIRVVKAFANEERENARFRAESQRLFKDLYKMARIQRLSSPLTELLSVLVGLFVLWYGGRQVLGGDELPPQLFILFLFCVFSLGKPIKELSQVNNAIQEGLAAAERVFAVLDHPVEIDEKPDARNLSRVRGEIELRDVHFAYDNGTPVLRGVDLKVAPGEVVALVGASGAGKSTLVDLIPRFYDPCAGEVRLDGYDLRDLTLDSLRSAMGLVTQEVILFNDTVRNNIAYGQPGVGIDDVVSAARAANAHDFIAAMPEGYDTLIGDRGLKLSGGQRQRLSIARAILKNPPVLILDEATSALDTESEKLVQEAIDRLVSDRTTVVIAHRLSTIQHVDRIYVMDQGRIVQIGDHEALLAESDGPYRTLHDLQFRA